MSCFMMSWKSTRSITWCQSLKSGLKSWGSLASTFSSMKTASSTAWSTARQTRSLSRARLTSTSKRLCWPCTRSTWSIWTSSLTTSLTVLISRSGSSWTSDSVSSSRKNWAKRLSCATSGLTSTPPLRWRRLWLLTITSICTSTMCTPWRRVSASCTDSRMWRWVATTRVQCATTTPCQFWCRPRFTKPKSTNWFWWWDWNSGFWRKICWWVVITWNVSLKL